MHRYISLLFWVFLSINGMGQRADLITYYENSERTETPRYQETISYCRNLDLASPSISFTTFGKSPQGRDLPLLILDRDGLTDPASIRAKGRVILLVQACIHAGESEGKDAGLMLIRDLAFPEQGSDLSHLLNNVSIFFIPIFNVDGHERFGPYNRINQNGPREMGWRTTAGNLNLNRDFLKAEAPEMQAWLHLFNTLLPDFFMDIHTTDGADYQYVITYQMEIYGNMDPGLTRWARDEFLPVMTNRLEGAGYLTFPYVDFRNWHDPRSGLISEVAPPMLSQGYVALRNRPGLLIETHMLKPYHQRVSATYESITSVLEILNHQHAELTRNIRAADSLTENGKILSSPYPLQFETLMNDSVIVDFRGIEYDVMKSTITGGTWFNYGKTPATFRIPYFSKTRPSITTTLPYAYMIPAEWSSVIAKLRNHGIRMKTLTKDTTLLIETYRLKNPRWQSTSYEGHHIMTNIETEDITEKRWLPAGSVLVPMNQQAARIIPQMLEPKGSGSLLSWGFFDIVMEQKEYGESYVLEKMAAEMLSRDPSLKSEYEQKMATDTLFAKTPLTILNWFYNKTPYSDSRKGIYPIGKIYDKNVADRLLKE